MEWEPEVKKHFEQMIEKIPEFMRPLAQKKVLAKAERVLEQNGRQIMTKKDLVDAFFEATPFGFHGPMKTDMKELGIEYEKYGYN